jgi:hypothetical protein
MNALKKNLTLFLFAVLICVGCQKVSVLPNVEFEWFNLSTNEICIADVTGIPPQASCGRLMPSHAEDRLESSASGFSETVKIKSEIKIKWNDNGTNGFHNAFDDPGKPLPGIAHQTEFKRDELGIPSKLTDGKIRFTYLGSDKWRVKFFPHADD